MHHRDEDDIIFAFLLYAYKLAKEEEEQQQLLALVDANYKFLWIELGGVGNMSDAQIFNDTELYECLQEGSIGVPPPCPMTNDDQDMPYVWYDSAPRPTKLC